MRRRALLGASVAGVLGACEPAPTADYRYRLKFVVEIGGRAHEGSSVIRVRWRDLDGRSLSGAHFRISVRAEAAVADLGQNGLLFATLKRASEEGFSYISHALPELLVDYFDMPTNEQREAAIASIPAFRQEVFLPRSYWPVFVRFESIEDPTSVQEVNDQTIEHLYGAGSRFVSVSMQVVDDEPTQRISRTLPWLDALDTSLAGEGRLLVRGTIAQRLGETSFKIQDF